MRTLFISLILATLYQNPSILFGINTLQFITFSEFQTLKNNGPSTHKPLESLFLWHLKTPTTGLLPTNTPYYPYLPHLFTLDELSPKKGAGVTVVLIDTGVAAFPLPDGSCCKHPDLYMPGNLYTTNFTIRPTSLKLRRAGTQPLTIRTPVWLGPPYNAHAIKEYLPLPDTTTGHRLIHHGSHSFGTIAANGPGIMGLAPKARVYMIKAFDQFNTSRKSILIKALQTAQNLNADIVNLGLKVADTIDPTSASSQKLEKLLTEVPFVVAAAGNKETHLQRLVYPARFTGVDFSVGAFDSTGNIPEFSTYEMGIGPMVLAPGVDIIGCSANPQQPYIFLSGTSVAVPMVTSLLARVLAEFRYDFYPDEIRLVLYASTMRLENSPAWRRACLYGVIDMRTALFVLQVLRALKHYFYRDFHQRFIHLLNAILWILFEQADSYVHHRVSLRDSLNEYMHAAAQISGQKPPHRPTLMQAIRTITREIKSIALKRRRLTERDKMLYSIISGHINPYTKDIRMPVKMRHAQ